MQTLTKPNRRKPIVNSRVATKSAPIPKKEVKYEIIPDENLDSFKDGTENNLESGQQDTRDFCESENTIVFTIKSNGKELDHRMTLQFNVSPISCGILEIQNISTWESVIKSVRLENRENLKKEIANMFTKIIEIFKKQGRFAFVLFSNNNQFPNINSVIDSICELETHWEVNPNSKSRIKIWMV